MGTFTTNTNAGAALNAYGLRVTTGNLTQTTGTLTENGLFVDSASTTLTSGTINGLMIGNVTDPGSAVTSTAINIGSGWDFGLSTLSPALVKAASTSAFQTQNSSGITLLGVDTSSNNSNNLLTNPSIETGGAPPTGWTAKVGSGGSTPTQVTSPNYDGGHSMQVVTSGTATNAGVTQSFALTGNTTYALSVYVDSLSGFVSTAGAGTFDMGFGSSGADTSCLTAKNAPANGWTRFTCTFTTPASLTTPYIYFKQTDSTPRTFFIDSAVLETDANATTKWQDGIITLNGTIASPVIIQPLQDSSNTFLVQNSEGISVFGVDTTDTNLVTNPGLEVNLTSWTYSGTQSNTVGNFRDTSTSYLGAASLKLIMSASATDQTRFTFSPSTLLQAGTTYTFSFYAKDSATSYATFTYGHREGAADTNCTTTGAINTTWQRYSCSFTWTTITSPYLFISAGSASKTINIDAVSLEPGSTASPYGSSSIYLNGVVTSPVNFQNKSNSTLAFNIQDTSSNSLFSVDTSNDNVNFAVPAGGGLKVAATAASTTDLLSISNANGATSTTGVSGASVNFNTTGSTASADNSGFRVDVTSNNSGATTTLEGLKISNLSSPEANSTETGLYVGTGWDIGLDLESGGIQLAAQTTPAAPASGLIRLYAKSVAGRVVLKTIGSAGLDTPLQNALWQNNTVMWTPSTAAGVWQGASGGAVGTAAILQPTTTNLYTSERRSTYAPASAAANIQNGIRSDAQFFHGNVAGNGGFFAVFHFGTSTWTAGDRLFVGFGVCTTACTTANPSSLVNIAAFGIDAGDTAITFMHNDGSGTATKDAIAGQPTLASNQGYDAYIYLKPNDSTIYYRLDDTNAATTIIDTSTATDIIAVNTMVVASADMGTGTNATIASSLIGINRIYVETDH